MTGKRIDRDHVILKDGSVYCNVQGDQEAPVITHSRVKCAFCGKVLQSMHNNNPISRRSPQPGFEVFMDFRNKDLAQAEKYAAHFHKMGYETEIIDGGRAPFPLTLFVRKRANRNPVTNRGKVHIYGQTEKIFMRKTRGPYKGQRFVHDFKKGVEQVGFPRGTVIQTPDGKTCRLTTRSVLLTGKKDLYRNFPA